MYNTQDMHHIQKNIIHNLARSSPLRFTQLQPLDVPNNTFSYHLKKLLETGYVVMSPGGYIATRKALKILSYATPDERRFVRPASITILFVTNLADEVLLMRRHTQPFKHHYGTPSGLIHSGETVEQAARRELYEKTTILAEVDSLLHCGTLDFRYQERESKDTFVHAIGFIYSYKYTGDPLAISGQNSRYGELFWSKLNHADILPEVYEISKIISEDNPTLRSIDFEEPFN